MWCSYRISPPLFPTGVNIYDEATCTAEWVDYVGIHCTWCSVGSHCTLQGCMQYHDISTCPTNGMGCYWSADRGMCVNDVCMTGMAMWDEATCWATIGSGDYGSSCYWDGAMCHTAQT